MRTDPGASSRTDGRTRVRARQSNARRVSLASGRVADESHRRPRGREVVARQRKFLARFWEFALQTWRSYGSIVVLANLNFNNDQIGYNGFNVATYET